MKFCTLMVCFVFGATLPLLAQVDIGQISGRVSDNSKAVVPDAKVVAINEGNQTRQVTVTNNSGYYTFPSLMVGNYAVTIEAQGFQKFSQTGIHLSSADQLNISPQMTVGNINQTVQVSDSGESVALSNEPMTGGTVTSKQFEQLEVNGRNPIYLALLEPGVVGSEIANALLGNFNTYSEIGAKPETP